MRYHHGNLKSNLIDCAYEWIASNGIDNISLRKIAEIAEVSQTAPYRHFKSKEHLLAEVATLGFEKLSFEIDKNITTDDATDDLVRCGVTYIEFGLNNEHIIDLMFNYPIKKSEYPSLLESADTAFGCEKSKRSLSGATIEPFCATWSPSTWRNASCSKCVAEWLARSRRRRSVSITSLTGLPLARVPLTILAR